MMWQPLNKSHEILLALLYCDYVYFDDAAVVPVPIALSGITAVVKHKEPERAIKDHTAAISSKVCPTLHRELVK